VREKEVTNEEAMTSRKILMSNPFGVAGVLSLVILSANRTAVQSASGPTEGGGREGCSVATLQGDYLFTGRTDVRSDALDPMVIGYRGPDGAARGWNAGKGMGVGGSEHRDKDGMTIEAALPGGSQHAREDILRDRAAGGAIAAATHLAGHDGPSDRVFTR
jgi:hypothetical protein